MSIPKEKIIDIRELRIGNYLLYDGKIVHVTFLSMDIDDEYEESIGFCELGKTTNEKADWNRALCDKLERIPLRTEWLERFGFATREMPFTGELGYGMSGKGNFIGFVPTDDNVWLIHNPHFSTTYYCVHQLQNLYFALTGEELTIKELQP